MNDRYRNYKKALGIMINDLRRNGYKYTDSNKCTFSYIDMRTGKMNIRIVTLRH